MQTYTLYDMISHLKLDIWEGGMVDRLCYISVATEELSVTDGYGFQGVGMSTHAMLESCETSSSGNGCQLTVSIFNPCKGLYHVYSMQAKNPDRNWIVSQIKDIVTSKGENYVRTHNIEKSNIYNIERQYNTHHSSMRSGSIGSPHKSKIFKK